MNDFRAAFDGLMSAVQRAAALEGAAIDYRNLIPPPPPSPEALTRQAVAASLAGGIIAASGKPHTVAEALAVFKDVLDGVAQ